MAASRKTVTGICTLCLEERQLIDSHILPNKAFFGDIFAGEGPNKLISANNNDRDPLPKNPMQTGSKEPLLCFDCDSKNLGRHDTYFTAFARNGAGTQVIESSRGFEVSGVDYTSMRLAQLSFLWRMSVASDPLFGQVSLPDEDQERIRRMLLVDDPGEPDFYPCVGMHSGTLSDVFREGVLLAKLNNGETLRMFATGLVWLWFLSPCEQNLLAKEAVQPDGQMLFFRASKELLDDFGTEVQDLVRAMERKPNAEKLEKWGWNK